MLSPALTAVLLTATPAQPTEKTHTLAQIESGCNAQSVDPKFVHFVEKTPSERAFPGLRLVSHSTTVQPFVSADASSCVTYLTRLNLRR